ncbi:MAG: NYN domain-containing protein [Pseudorhodoplanes sp.]|nr:NYN domain-containing protein [Pseudorhodoplanes sp.]
MRTHVYVDGFNLYYGALRKTPFKWLDLEKLCNTVLKATPITAIKYFTARVAARANDPDQSVRQEVYLRALATNPKIEIYFGHFLSHSVRMPICDGQGNCNGQYATVLKTEEKGSDVNLAAHMLLDAHYNRFDQAIVVSNDSDLLTPIRFVRREFGKRVGVLNPHRRQSQVLLREADFVRPIREGALKVSQFPERMSDKVGNFSRPFRWRS